MCSASELKASRLSVQELSAQWQPSGWTGSPRSSRERDMGALASSVRHSQGLSSCPAGFSSPACTLLPVPSSSSKHVTAKQAPDSEGVPMCLPGVGPGGSASWLLEARTAGLGWPKFLGCPLPASPLPFLHHLIVSACFHLCSPLRTRPHPTICRLRWSRWRITAL